MKQSRRIWKRFGFACLAILILPLIAGWGLAAGPIIVDHNCTDVTRIPDYWLDEAKKLTFHYAHTSHGEQITLGLDALEGMDPTFSVAVNEDGQTAAPPPLEAPPALRIYDGNPQGTYIEPQDYWQTDAGLNRTRAVLDTGLFGYSMWAWCGQLSWYNPAEARAYLESIRGLGQEYPDVTVIYMTGHLDGDPSGDLTRNNNMIRDWVKQNNGVLFDFADIETYSPDGTPYLDGTDACDWCAAWCAANPNDCAGLPAGGDWGHTHPFNSLNKGKAFWWMMARLAGWNSECAAYHPDRSVVHIPYLDIAGQSYWVDFNVTPQGLTIGSYGFSQGEGVCARWNGSAVQVDCLAIDASGQTYGVDLTPVGSVWGIQPTGP